MTESKRSPFHTKFGDIARELESLKIKRQERHDEFLRRLSEMKERCDKLTDHRMQRLKTEGIDIDIETVRAAQKHTRYSYTRSATLPVSDPTRRDERIRSSETERSLTQPQLRMELSFHCREPSKTVHFEESDANLGNSSTAECDTDEEANITGKCVSKSLEEHVHDVARGGKIKLSRNPSYISRKAQKGKTVSDDSAKLTSRPVNNNFKMVKSNLDSKKVIKNNAQQNFKRLSNKLSSIMRVMNYRRHTISSTTPWELRPRYIERYVKLQKKDSKVPQQKGIQVVQKHVLKKRERHARIRMYSEGSLSTEAGSVDTNKKLRRVSMTIQSVKQFERK